MIAALALSLALGTTAPSDLGVVFASSAGTAQLVAACPRVAVVATSSGGADLLRSYLQACPGGFAVFQLPGASVVAPATSAAAAQAQASTYWSTIAPFSLSAVATTLSSAERAATWLGGPTNFETFPSWRTDTLCDVAGSFCAADYAGAFWAELDRLVRADGYAGVVLPPFAPAATDRPSALCDLLLGIDQASGGASDLPWTWDAISPGLAQSATDEASTTFGYRSVRATCTSARAHPLLVRASAAGGWQTRTTADGYLAWLAWLDRAVAQDPAPFLGVAVFGYGTSDANDLAPIAARLAAYIVDPSVPPDGGGGGGSNGGVGPGTTPPTTPGSNLGPDSGSGRGCSSGGSPGALGLLAVAAAAARRTVRPRARG